MGDDLYTHLAWLPKPPADFRQQCRVLAESKNVDGRVIMRLAGYALNESQLRQLDGAIRQAIAQGQSLAPLIPFTLGLLGNSTLEPLVPLLVASAARHGIALSCVMADFGQTIQEALPQDSIINRARPDAVLLALDYRGLPLKPGLYSEDAVSSGVSDAMAFLEALRAGFRKNSSALSIVQTLAPPSEAVFGSLDRLVPGTLRNLTNAFNAALIESLRDTADVLFDVAALAETIGLSNWYSPTQWNIAKLAFDSRFLPLYADHIGRILAAIRGKSRRCLVLDLDNTVWGGVIGDDGIEGIVIGQGDATGEAYLEIQQTALALRDRGIVLAVSSKNDDAVARKAFIHHPEMLLRENHIAVFQANWNDKATNISAIAAELALSIDAMVLLDDNPAERALVREMLPQAAVPELPENPALYARTLAAAGYFEAITFSDEDRKRAEFYEGNMRRVALQDQVGDLQGYLASLEMRIIFRPFDAAGRSRIAQLINKSNQFNLTTRRYTESDVAAFETNPECFTLQVRLIDAFGDNGMISVIICREISDSAWEIDTWLMSCRVLGRRVEDMVLREILHHARKRNIGRLIGRYFPTERNRLVGEHYAKLGFCLVQESSTGTTVWELGVDAQIKLAPMVVDRTAFESPNA